VAEAERLGKYQLTGLIALGGMGEVWLATQTGPGGFERQVVVKRVLRQLAHDPEFVRLFLEEARLAALLSHPNVVQLIELGEEGGEFFIAMEQVRGVTFRSLMSRSEQKKLPLSDGAIAALGAQVLHGLHAAHTLVDSTGSPVRLVHRDVTPENLMLTTAGQVKVLDFGVAKALARSGPKTLVARGKVQYMAPEQLSEGRVSPQSDMFSLGLVLEELAQGRALHPALQSLLDRATALEPDGRWPHALAFATALEALSAELGRVGPAALGALMTELFPEGVDLAAQVRPATAAVPRQKPAPEPLPSTTTVVAKPARAPVWPSFVAAALLVAGLAAVLMRRGETKVAPAPPAEPVASAPVTAGEGPPPHSGTHVEALDLTLSPRPTPASAKGRVDVQVAPWAEVYFQGKNLGITPIDPIELPAGSQALVLKNPRLGVERRVVVQVRPGAVTKLKVDLLAN
jgi:eukaryotic-like serine/threonine-protein kinase